MMRSMVWVAVFTLSPVVDAKCAMMGLAPEVITKSGAVMPPDGGFLVDAADTRGEGDDTPGGDVAVQPTWRFALGTKLATPVLETIAPGLVRYRLPAGATDVVLQDAKQSSLGHVTVAPGKRAMLAAPKPKHLAYSAFRYPRSSAGVDVTLDGVVPAGAVAIVMADAKGKPRSWGRVEAGAATVTAYGRHKCSVLPNGTVESKPGDRVILFWVDEAGRTSPASKPIAIAKSDKSED